MKKKSQKKNKIKYPNLERLKIPINYSKEGRIDYVFYEDIVSALDKEQLKKFDYYFGVQTCPVIGDGKKNAMFSWDVEDVLQRMFTGKRQGTQYIFD